MKKSLVAYFAIQLVLAASVFAQNTQIFHYPLRKGNKWEYEEKSGGILLKETMEVIGDTLLPTGKIYSIIEQIHQRDGRRLVFKRIEQNKVYQYSPRFVPPNSVVPAEILLLKLDVAIGDIWPYPFPVFSSDSCFYKVDAISFSSFFNRRWKKMEYEVISLPSASLCTGNTVFLDSLGVYYEGFEGGYYQLRGALIDGKHYGILTQVNETLAATNMVPSEIAFFTTYPNPVISEIKIILELRRPSEMQISIFDLMGRQIHTFPFRNYGKGLHALSWNGKDESTNRYLTNGLYFLTLTNKSNERLIRKFMLMK